MKKTLSIAFCVLIASSLLMVGIVKAGNSTYSILEYVAVDTCVVDGKWTTPTEWTDGPVSSMTGNMSGGFVYNIQDFTNLGIEWLVEALSDNTNNTGDYMQICFDDLNTGGTAPNTGCFMIEIDGHTTLKVYQGTGAGWAQVTPAAGEISWANTLGTSMYGNQTHWIYEVVDSSKTAGTVQIPDAPPTGMGATAFDAATNKYCSWAPNMDARIPNTYGVLSTYSMDPIPEGFSVGAIVLLSAAAMMVGFYYLRKRPRIANLSPTKL